MGHGTVSAMRMWEVLHAAPRTKEALLKMDVDGAGTGDQALAIARGIMDRFTRADFARIHP